MENKSLKEIKQEAEKKLQEYNKNRKRTKTVSEEELVLERNKKHKDQLKL